MKKIIVAVDGTSGSGKTDTFKKVAKQLEYKFVDTGLIYRAFTLLGINYQINFDNEEEIIALLPKFNYEVIDEKVLLNKTDITNNLETQEIVTKINYVTKISQVRDFMVSFMRSMVKEPGIIMVGRDITSIVLPNADLKIYLDSTIESRTDRRYEQYLIKNVEISKEAIKEAIINRDDADKNRKIGPLLLVDDAWYIDNSTLSIKEVVQKIVAEIKKIEME